MQRVPACTMAIRSAGRQLGSSLRAWLLPDIARARMLFGISRIFVFRSMIDIREEVRNELLNSKSRTVGLCQVSFFNSFSLLFATQKTFSGNALKL